MVLKAGAPRTIADDLVLIRAATGPLLAELEEWRACAKYDATMEGPRFKGWDRSALDRCRHKFIEKGE